MLPLPWNFTFLIGLAVVGEQVVQKVKENSSWFFQTWDKTKNFLTTDWNRQKIFGAIAISGLAYQLLKSKEDPSITALKKRQLFLEHERNVHAEILKNEIEYQKKKVVIDQEERKIRKSAMKKVRDLKKQEENLNNDLKKLESAAPSS